jgi:hypothetical protein
MNNKYLNSISDRALKLFSDYDVATSEPPPPAPPPPYLSYPAHDEFKGRRLMAWVMVNSTRLEITSTIFIDPATGDLHPITADIFGGIELAFNHRNVWINTQAKSFVKTEDSMDFSDSSLWLPVLNLTDLSEKSDTLKSVSSVRPQYKFSNVFLFLILLFSRNTQVLRRSSFGITLLKRNTLRTLVLTV